MNLSGKRQKPQKGAKDRIKELEVALQNTEMANRISQMMLKQILEQFQGLRRDVDNTMGILNDFQYRTLSMLELGKFDKVELDKLAEKFKLEDYMRASNREDLAKGYQADDDGVVEESSVVIITSSTNGDDDKGIFRSKFRMEECQTESLREKLLGSKVGDSIEEQINGDLHKITIVGLRKVTQQQGENIGEENESN